MEKLTVAFALILLIALSYTTVNFKKIEHSYHILIGIINIWCIIAFLYIKNYTDFNYDFITYSFILSLIFHLIIELPKIKLIKILSIIIVWIFTVYACILFFSMANIFMTIIQPIGYLFGFYLLKYNYEKNIIPVFINLLLTWGCLCLTIYFLLNN